MTQTLAGGQVFAGYRIERLLGVGATGSVYLAHDRDLPRWVALKIVNPAVSDGDEVRDRFLRQSGIAAQLVHPNIATIYARGQEGDQLWVAMQYVEGIDGAALLRHGPVDPQRAVRIITGIAKALDYAHSSGVLHQNVKPGNILLSGGADEHAFLADFGLADALDPSGSLARTGVVDDGFCYAAPERFDATGDVDHRADIYALGCVFYHLIVGIPPYPGSDPGALSHGHRSLPVPRPSERNPTLPYGFDDVVARALAKDRNFRFGSGREFASAATAALQGTQPPRNPPPPSHAPKRGSTLILALVAAVVLGILGVGTTFAVRNGYVDKV